MAKAKEVTEAVDTSAEETIQEEVQHSDWFYKVKDYYDTKRWNLVVGSFFIAEKRNKTAGKINIQNNQNQTGYFDEKFPRHDRRF